MDEVAAILARACGHGSGAEYLFSTVAALHASEIHDPHFSQLQDLVANEIRQIHCGAAF